MRVVQVNAIFGAKSTGTIVLDIQKNCEAHGIDCYVAYSILSQQCDETDKCYRIGNKVTAKWQALISRLIGKQAYANRVTTWFFLRWLDKVKPDVVHLHNLHSNFIHINMLLHYLAKHDIATVVTMHDCWYFTGGCMHYASVGCERWKIGCGHCPKRKQIPSLFFDTTKAVLKDRVTYLTSIPRLTMVGASEWIANEMKESRLKWLDITFIHNGFDLNVFSPTTTSKRKELGLEHKFVIIGPSTKWLLPVNKPTLDYFISHMSDDMVLVLFGSSGSMACLTSKVKFLGYTRSRKEMAEIYSMADVMVNCSREDTLSSLNLECQACGTPVVTYEATGNKETVDGICGFAVTTGDHRALFDRVKYIKSTGKRIIGKACREWIVLNYNKEMAYNYYIKLYEKHFLMRSE